MINILMGLGALMIRNGCLEEERKEKKKKSGWFGA
jgi:hypothetical protein